MNTNSNAHTLIKEQLEDHLNRHKNLAQLIHILHETFTPLVSVNKLPSIPHLNVIYQVCGCGIIARSIPFEYFSTE